MLSSVSLCLQWTAVLFTACSARAITTLVHSKYRFALLFVNCWAERSASRPQPSLSHPKVEKEAQHSRHSMVEPQSCWVKYMMQAVFCMGAVSCILGALQAAPLAREERCGCWPSHSQRE